jgi:release factor glutamine methyltransferase
MSSSIEAATSAREALEGAVTAIAAAGCDTPRLDAELLLAHALGVERQRLIVEPQLPVAGVAVRAFQDAVRRRAVEREPVAYIVGRRAFRRLELNVDSRALVPRPETELLVEVGLGLPAGARVLDLGTGCGAVALSLKDERPDLRVSASDISSGALELARLNARELQLDVHWLQSDLLSDGGEYDAVLANLPYVRDSERSSLAPEILRHEPPEALFAGPDGLTVIRRLLDQVAHMPDVRLLALELGAGQASLVDPLIRAARFDTLRFERDLAHVQRVVVAERHTPEAA